MIKELYQQNAFQPVKKMAHFLKVKSIMDKGKAKQICRSG